MSSETTTRCPQIPDAAWEAAAAHYAYWNRGFNDVDRDTLRVVAPILWRAWLAGRVVVDLPEPVAGTEQSWSSPVGRIASSTTRSAGKDNLIIEVGNWRVLTGMEAEQLAFALLAAARLSVPGSSGEKSLAD